MKTVRNTSVYVVAGIIPNVVNLFLLPVYTRFLEPADYGLVALVTTLVSFIGTVAGLQVANSLSRLFFDHEGEDLKTFVSTVLFGMLGINVFLFSGYHLAGDTLTGWLFPKAEVSYIPYVLLGLIGLFFTVIVNFCNALLRVQERAGVFLYAALSFVAVGAILGIYFVVVRQMGAQGVLLATACTAMLQSAILLFYIRSMLVLRFRWSMFRAALRFSLPLIPHAIGGVLFLYTDKYILSFYVPLASIGLYDLACRLANVLRMIINSYHAAIMPDFMRSSRLDKAATTKRYADIITKWAVILAILFLGLSLYAEELIALLAPQSYRGAYVYVPILVGAFIFRGLHGFAVNAVLFEKKTKLLPVITFTAGLLNVGLNILLIPRFGVLAAAWTTLLAHLFTFALTLGFSRKYYALRIEWAGLAWIYGLMLGVFFVGWYVRTPVWYGNVVIKTAAFAVFCFLVWMRNPGGLIDDLRMLAVTLYRKVVPS